MLLLDLTHTSHSAARTGIQRLARELWGVYSAAGAATAICHDPFARQWRRLRGRELEFAAGRLPPSASRGARWTLRQRLGGWLRRATRRPSDLPAAEGLIVPEIFSPAVARALPGLFAAVGGPRIALFLDALPLTHPEFAPPSTVARFPAYMLELAAFDGVAAISQHSADDLTGYWRWAGITAPPPVQVVMLAAKRPPVPTPPPPAGRPRILSVGTIEGRKNHLALVEAAESLWAQGRDFELQFVGLARPETAAKTVARIGELQAAGRPLVMSGVLDEAALEAAWAGCAFSVYPSALEGFGLPILESLARGRACVCAGGGAPGEFMAGGGCVGLDPIDAPALAGALAQLLDDPPRLARLTAEARRRPLATWAEVARDLRGWMDTLPRR